VLGDGNIIFFIYVLQESIVYNVQCFAFEWALVNQPAIILADEPCADLEAQDSNIIPEHNLEDDPVLKQTIVIVSHGRVKKIF
jgi:ABC-type lipoprotein export system ATPase subunit